MGCDGGTIPRRDELVRVKKKPEQKDKDAETVAKWKHCAISQEPLRPPIVSCDLGRLYNKEVVIEYLLRKDNTCELASHIRSLKDVKELNLTENTGFRKRDADKGDQYVDRHDSRYICPVVGLEMNGKYRFCYLRTCGCVLSERAVKEVKSEVCHKCAQPFDENDVIIINGTEEEIITLIEKMKERQLKAKLQKKSKKHKASTEAAVEEKKQKLDESPSTSGISNRGVNESSKKVQKSLVTNGKVNGNSAPDVSSATKLILPEKAHKSYSVAKDPTASEAFKSLFTSHKDARNQPKAHWITHNPLYY